MNENSYPIVLSETNRFAMPSSDCNCACPPSPTQPSPAALAADTQLQRHPQQQQIALSPLYSAVFVPSWSQIAVLNGVALALLQRFDTPHTLAECDASDQAALHQMYALGLLIEPGRALPVPAPADELVAWLHVTNACNLRCTYCYLNKDADAMSAATAFAAIDAVLRSAQLHGYRKVLLKYAGGEASLNLALVEQLHCYAQAQAQLAQIELSEVLLSNGVGLGRRKIARIRDTGMRLMLSLDGLKATHDAQRPRIGGQGSFDAALASVVCAQEHGIDLTISITVTGASVAGLPELLGWLLEREIHFSLNFYRECDASASFRELQLDEQQLIAGMRAAYRAIERQLPRYSLLGALLDRTNLGARHSRTCAVGENYLVIDQRGAIAKCQMEIERPISTVWAADPLQIIRLDQTGVQNIPVEDKAICRSCEWKHWCAGGCAVATFRATGRYDIQSPNCAIYRALYPEVIRLEGLRLLAQRDEVGAA